MLESLAQAGVDVVRLNFSHGEHAQHLAGHAVGARDRRRSLGRPIAILQDLSGPKIRTGRLKDGEPVELRKGERITITTDETIEGTARAHLHHLRPAAPGRLARRPHPPRRRQPRAARASRPRCDEVECEVVHGGLLKSEQGDEPPRGEAVHARPHREGPPRPRLRRRRTASTTSPSRSCARPRTSRSARRSIKSLGGTMPVIAKIEKREAIDDLPAILEATDGVMVARGRPRRGAVHRGGARPCRSGSSRWPTRAGKVVITATQMLESMIENPRPTRAEASDVANAILDGTDAIMLSAETASGKFPVEAVATMARIARYTEEHYGAFRAARARRHRRRVRGGAQPGAGGAHGGRGAGLQAHRGLHGVGHHRPARLDLPAARARSPPSPTTRTPTGGSPCGGAWCR